MRFPEEHEFTAQHDFGNTLFNPDSIESMHFISAEGVVKICQQVMKKITTKFKLKTRYEIFDENETPALVSKLYALKRFLITDDVMQFMNRKHTMNNHEDILFDFKHLVKMLFLEAFLYVYKSMTHIPLKKQFKFMISDDPVSWVVEYMVAKFSQSNYIFKRSGKDIQEGLWIL
jgi:hypothetical protein